MRVLLQGNQFQKEICGIPKPKFVTPKAHGIAAPGTVEELKYSLVALLHSPALHQH